AEDGIRDFQVTGVQTCALPICRRPQPPLDPSLFRGSGAPCSALSAPLPLQAPSCYLPLHLKSLSGPPTGCQIPVVRRGAFQEILAFSSFEDAGLRPSRPSRSLIAGFVPLRPKTPHLARLRGRPGRRGRARPER